MLHLKLHFTGCGIVNRWIKLNFIAASLPFLWFDMRGLLTFKIENFGPTLKLIYNFNIIIKKQPVKK